LTTPDDVRPIRAFDLSEGVVRRGGDFALAVLLFLAAAGWFAAMVGIASSGYTRGHPFAVVLATGSIPLAWAGLRLWRRARLSHASLQITADAITIVCPTLLREPLCLRSGDVRAVIVDDTPTERFAVVDDPDWSTGDGESHVVGHLWRASAGGALPLLSLAARVPSCAILFNGARTLSLVASPAVGDPTPSRRPLPARPEAGLLLCIDDVERLRASLAGWPTSVAVHMDDVNCAHQPVGGAAKPPPEVVEPDRVEPDRSSPIQPAAAAPPLRSRRQASARILATIGALAAGALMVTLLSGTVLAATLTGRVPVLVGGVAAAVGIVLIWVLWPRQRTSDEIGEKARRNAQPELWGIVDETSSALGLPPPDDVRLTLWPTFSLSQRMRPFVRVHTTLRLGLPVLALLSRNELRVLVATTLNGRRHHAALLVNLAWRARHPLQRVASMRAHLLVLELARRGVRGLLAPFDSALQRSADVLVDAVVLDGAEQVARHWPAGELESAGRKVEVAQSEWDAYWRGVVVPGLEGNRPPALAEDFRSWIEQDATSDPATSVVHDLTFLEDRLLA
jgi:hypothetical protein